MGNVHVTPEEEARIKKERSVKQGQDLDKAVFNEVKNIDEPGIEQRKNDPRTDSQIRYQENMDIRANENNAILSQIDATIDPQNTEMTKRAQHLFNVYVFEDDVLDVDGVWGNKTQEAFVEYRDIIKKYANLQSAGMDLKEHNKRYNINVSKKTEFDKQIERDERVKELNSRIPQ